MLRPLLDEHQEALVKEERERLEALRLTLAHIAGVDDAQTAAA